MVTRGNVSEARISTKWTNRSVLALAQDSDPIAIVIAKARALRIPGYGSRLVRPAV